MRELLRRRDRRALGGAALALALTLGLVPAPASARADRATTAVLARDTEGSPAGTLSTTTIGLGRTGGTKAAGKPLGPGWTTEVVLPAGTQQVGLSWVGDPAARFELRTRASDGSAWSAASVLEGEVEEGPDGVGGRPGAGPLWLGAGAVGSIQVRVVEGTVSDLRVDAMAWRAAATKARAATKAAPATPAGGPTINLRAAWAPGGWMNNDPLCGTKPKVNSRLDHAIVHHTDGANGYRAADVPGILAGIYRFHTGTRGWCDIAYNFLIDRFGGVWEGRLGGLDNATWGGHAQGFNSRSVGVALLGTHQTGTATAAAQPSAASLTALRDVLAWKLGAQGLDPTAKVTIPSGGNARFKAGVSVTLPMISGHGDTGYTSCPGNLLAPRLAQLRLDVKARIAATNDAARWAPQASGAAWFGRLLLDAEGKVSTPARIGSSTSRVVRGGESQLKVAAEIVVSTATDSRIGAVDRLRRTLLGRPATTTELVADVARRDQGTLARNLATTLLASPEFAAANGRSSTDTAFVTLLYRNGLGRAPSAAELSGQLSKLRAGTSRGALVVVISESVELKRRIAAEEQVVVAWYALLRRAPSATERSAWTGRLGSGSTTTDLVSALLASPEYRARR